ncbi:MAG: hypothetical protein HBSAPP04_01180 [Ignavibacteriaceae bacterium]|nr:MAG: hypothetical protein HBSAPP04_01180 [Ignavibacteriaceae bacterium]
MLFRSINVVLADAGFGKTTILKKLATEIAVDSIRKVEEGGDTGVVIPVFISFTELVKQFRTQNNIINGILNQILENKLNKKVDRNEIVLFIDSFDDLTPDQVNIFTDLKFMEWVNNQKFPVYISSRPPINLSGLASHNLITPLGFDKDSIGEFIDSWGIKDKAQRDILVESPLSRVPILLFLMCKESTRALSKNTTRSQGQLYKSIVISMIRESWNTNQLDQGIKYDSKILDELRLLGSLSWHLHMAGRSEFDIDWLSNRFGNNCDQFASLIDGSPLFIPESSEGKFSKIQFIHKSFLEFLAAHFLSSKINSEGWASKVEYAKDNEVDIRTLIDKKAWLPEWEAVIIFMAGLLEDRNKKELLNIIRAQDDIFKHRLSLAARCLPEVLSNLAD